MKKNQTISLLHDFMDSNFENIEIFKEACDTNTNLKIYMCLTDDKISEVIEKIKVYKKPNEIMEYLLKTQPSINVSLEVYENVVEKVRTDMEQYLKYNGFKMANAWGDQNDWTNHFYVKYYYFVNFYKDRWFFPETLKKETKVRRTYKKYSDFLNLARKAITEERKVQARKAAENPEATMNKTSVDSPMFQNNTRITMLDITHSNNSQESDEETFESYHNAQTLKRKILEFASLYESGKYRDRINQMLETGECRGKKNELVLLKIFAYKSGVVTVKSLKFINSLSRTYKEKFGISTALVNKQMKELGLKK